MSRFVVGDIHGCYDKLKTSLELAKFSANDTLYAVGDYCDRGTQNLKTLRFLMSLKENFKGVFGNHDIWAWQYLAAKFNGLPSLSRDAESCWMYNGGKTTLKEFSTLSLKELEAVFKWYSSLPYLRIVGSSVIVHALREKMTYPYMQNVDLESLNIKKGLEENYFVGDYDNWFWGRSIDRMLFSEKKGLSQEEIEHYRASIDEGFENGKDKTYIIGHTPYLDGGPHYHEGMKILNLDCASFAGKLLFRKEGQVCVMNLDTKEWFKSDGTIGVIR